MSEDEFWSITPRAFFNAVEGFESLWRIDLEIARLQTLYNVNMWAKKPIRDPKQLWRYPWEKVTITTDEAKAIRERGKKLAEKWRTR